MPSRRALLLTLLVLAQAEVAFSKTLSQRVYRQLTEVHELRDAGEYNEALRNTRDVLNSSRLTDFERAQTKLLLADLLLTKERYRDAVPVLEAILREPGLEDKRKDTLRFTLGQLYQQVGRYRDALQMLETWLRTTEEVPVETYFLLAVLCLELDRQSTALRYANEGREAAGNKLTQSQYEFLAAVYFQNSRWRDLRELLTEALEKFPNRLQFWTQLVQVHLEQKREFDALAVLRMAEKQGVLVKGTDLIRMAQLMRLQDTPWLAARVLEDGLRKGRIEATSRNHLMLGESWVAAREYEKAYPILRKVAEETGKSTDWMRLSQLYARDTQWKNCLDAARNGLRAKPKKPGRLHIMAGICKYEQGDVPGARESFEVASKHSNSRKEAQSWLQATRE